MKNVAVTAVVTLAAVIAVVVTHVAAIADATIHVGIQMELEDFRLED